MELIFLPLKIKGLTLSPSKKIMGLVTQIAINPMQNITNEFTNLDIYK
jgi:hypothetical protein